eukprot:scaffold2510_cov169-Amphora_coffeaeformis.AAC.14
MERDGPERALTPCVVNQTSDLDSSSLLFCVSPRKKEGRVNPNRACRIFCPLPPLSPIVIFQAISCGVTIRRNKLGGRAHTAHTANCDVTFCVLISFVVIDPKRTKNICQSGPCSLFVQYEKPTIRRILHDHQNPCDSWQTGAGDT